MVAAENVRCGIHACLAFLTLISSNNISQKKMFGLGVGYWTSYGGCRHNIYEVIYRYREEHDRPNRAYRLLIMPPPLSAWGHYV